MQFGYILISVYLKVIAIKGQLFYGLDFPVWPNYERDSNGTVANSFKELDTKLILTPLIDSWELKKARLLARVDRSHFLNVTSFSGYLTVDKVHNSNLWFWFFPAESIASMYEEDFNNAQKVDTTPNEVLRTEYLDRNCSNIPVILWLQGGPGSSSLFGLFTENGPFFINDDHMSIRENPYSWHKNYSMLFIDNPVGTGYSFTDDYVTSIQQSSKHLYSGLSQFFKLFPEYQSSSFYISGESFAGRYIPEIGREIVANNKKYDHLGEGDIRINLKGLMLGNAFTDPINMMDYSKFAYQSGLVDIHGKREMQIFEILAKENIDTGRGKLYWDAILYSFSMNSNYSNLYNILDPKAMNLDVYVKFVTQKHIRSALHVGSQEFAGIYNVYVNLIPDFLNSSAPALRYVLDESDVPVLYFSGNKDLIVAYPLSENFYRRFEWKGAKDYRIAKRQSLFLDDKLVGYYKKARNFHEAVILNAGHMAPTDQPLPTLDLISKFMNNEL